MKTISIKKITHKSKIVGKISGLEYIDKRKQFYIGLRFSLENAHLKAIKDYENLPTFSRNELVTKIEINKVYTL